MPAPAALACPSCHRPHDEEALACELCGHLFRREPRRAAAAPAAEPARSAAVETPPVDPTASRESWAFLAIGLVTGVLFLWLPFLSFMAWFLASLAHEMGHAAIAWLCGRPAVPAISPGGHAAAVHGEQSVLLVVVIALSLGTLLWHALAGRARWVALGLWVLLYPVLAFTGLFDLLHLLAGHGAELAFAALCLWKTLDGGFTDTRLERGLYGMLGWSLVVRNAVLCIGLLSSPAARAEYRSNGSFGFTNDYLRVADLASVPLSAVALSMLVLALLVVPAALAVWRLSSRPAADDPRAQAVRLGAR
jgi:hypothetical protein